MPPHEKTFTSPGGPTFVVGSQDESINKVPPLNVSGTVREVFVSGSSYTRSDAPSGGTLMVGYHVGCAVELQGGAVGLGPTAYLDPGMYSQEDLGPSVQVNVAPGSVSDVPLLKKEAVTGVPARITMRDIHLVVNGCIGPAVVRQYTLMQLHTDSLDDVGVVYGDPLWI
ncbi:MspA family porin [Nocardia nova]|uniref:MspA family porin n=1 Tax=Nocardia nova TaxID=37330 RepID=UPI0033FD0D40